jgi:hypothetical protein
MDCADLDFTPSGVDSLVSAWAKSRAQQTMNLKLDRTAVVASDSSGCVNQAGQVTLL